MGLKQSISIEDFSSKIHEIRLIEKVEKAPFPTPENYICKHHKDGKS